MTEITIFQTKKTIKSELKTKYNFQNKFNTFWVINLSNEEAKTSLIEWFKNLPINFVVIWEKEGIEGNIIYSKTLVDDTLVWFDFALVDNTFENIHDYSKDWVVSLVPENFYLKTIYKEFDALNSTWNTFFYTENNVWSMFYSIVRYLENSKFTYDNKNLIKNVIKM